jgi:dihydroorotase
MAYDLVIKNSLIIDPSQSLHDVRDIGIRNGRITAIEQSIDTSSADREIDARGKIVTPGLIDLHTHVAEHLMPISLDPNEAGINCGVTAVADGGSIGYIAYDAFKHFIVNKSDTDVFCFLHLSPTGQQVSPEICWESLNEERVLTLMKDEREIIKGMKIRANGQMVASPDLKVLKTAKRICSEVGMPLMIHIGQNFEENISEDELKAFNRKMLPLLGRGDIVTHSYTSRPGAVIHIDTGVMPELKEAKRRGVIIDVAMAKSHFNFDVARIGLDNGIVPDTLSTDITNNNYRGPALFSLPVVMSKFLALGLTLDEVVEKATIAPARVLNETHRRGSVTVGYPADITIIELLEDDFLFCDGIPENTLAAQQLIEPRYTIKSGRVFPAQSRFRNHVPGEPIPLLKGT